MERFIVGEVSKNWRIGMPSHDTLAERFEQVINFNAKRNYKLIDFRINCIVTDNVLNETIIAVFEHQPEGF